MWIRPIRIAASRNGGTPEKAPVMANRASTRTIQLRDRRRDYVSLDQLERIAT
jgi:hypothetical protein